MCLNVTGQFFFLEATENIKKNKQFGNADSFLIEVIAKLTLVEYRLDNNSLFLGALKNRRTGFSFVLDHLSKASYFNQYWHNEEVLHKFHFKVVCDS